MELTSEELRRVIDYEPETGKFTWKIRTSNRVKVGDIASARSAQGYLRLHIHGHSYLCHRLAWFYMTGAWPKNQIDHINLDRADNRFANLREATDTENRCNTTKYSNNTSGYKGVSLDKRSGRWAAELQVNRTRVRIGRFKTAEEASAAYCAAAEKYHGEFARF